LRKSRFGNSLVGKVTTTLPFDLLKTYRDSRQRKRAMQEIRIRKLSKPGRKQVAPLYINGGKPLDYVTEENSPLGIKR
jgi:hypothetical protein